MSLLGRVLVITFIESFATTCVERGIYFFSHDYLHFSDVQNLWLALAFGAAYVLGALVSHALCLRLREKGLLLLCLGGQLAVHLLMGAWTIAPVIVAGSVALGLLNGLKWPVIESYIGAGLTPMRTVPVIGRFNLAWSSAVPLALVVIGPIIASDRSGLFFLAAGINLVSVVLARPLPPHPIHLPEDHPDRPAAGQKLRYESLLHASRWLLLAKYSMLWILAALMPGIFARLGVSVSVAAGLSGLVDLMRAVAFALLLAWQGWHNRTGPIVLSVIALPAGFFLVLFGQGMTAVLGGEVLFGLAGGVVYYAALYYAMVVKNASVEAGGGHEGLIGLGFAVGPAAGLAGVALGPVLGGELPGTLAGVGPLLAACTIGALWSLRAILAGQARPSPEAPNLESDIKKGP